MKSKSLVALLLCLVMALGLLSGCGGGTTATPTPDAGGEATPTPAGDEPKVLTIGVTSDVMTLDPQAHAQSVTDNMFHMISFRLFDRASDMSIVPWLVTEYEIEDDTTWKMTIRDDAVFSNGDPLTSADVKFTLERAATDTSLIEYNFWQGIESVEIIDDYNFKIHTYDPKPDLLSLLAKSGGDIMPSKYIEEVGMEEYIKDPIMAGQYKLKEWIPADHWTLVRNEYYCGEPGIWDEIVFRSIPESSTRVAELLTGGVDIIDNVPPNEWDRINGNDGTAIVKGETSRILLLNIRLTDGYVTADPKVREAIELAIDKDMICNDLLQGAGIPTRTRVGNGVVGFNDELFGSENANLYDPERAKELLAEAGYGPGECEITYTGGTGKTLMDKEIATMVATMLEQAGFKVNLEIVEGSVLSEIWSSKTNKEIIQIALSDSQYDAAYPLIHYGDKNRVAGLTDYDSKECQALYEAAKVNMNLEERAEQMKQIQAIAAEDRPHVCLCQLSNLFGVSNSVSFTPRLDDMYIANEIVPAA
jgi:peptide/nickel transport system substrate-binding protein